MAKRLINLPETKGEFKVSGLVIGTEKGDKFFKSIKTKNNKDMNLLSFGVETDKNSTTYISLNGMARDEVYFYLRYSGSSDSPYIITHSIIPDEIDFIKAKISLLETNVVSWQGGENEITFK